MSARIYAEGHPEKARYVAAWIVAREMILRLERPDLTERQVTLLAVEQWNEQCAAHEREVNHRN